MQSVKFVLIFAEERRLSDKTWLCQSELLKLLSMAKGKLILICQSGGNFLTNDDGSLSYSGGEAHPMVINPETVFNDLKLKLSEMWKLELKSVAIKYFLPGNRRTLITLSSDRDLRRMMDFHGDSVTADVFVTGKEGYDQDALEMRSTRESGLKLTETGDCVSVPTSTATETPTGYATHNPGSLAAPSITPSSLFTVPIFGPDDSEIAATKTTARDANCSSGYRVAPITTSSSLFTVPISGPDESLIAVMATPGDCNKVPTSPKSSHATVTGQTDATADNQIEIDMTCTPADTVKKRRRTASWKVGANGPIIVSVDDDVGEKSKTTSCKKTRSYQEENLVAKSDDDDFVQGMAFMGDDFDDLAEFSHSDDTPLEKLVASWKDGITGVSQGFKGVHEFRDSLQKYAIANRFVYRLTKNDTNRASGRCVVEGCSWRIHASWVPTAQSFQIKKMNNLHTCEGESWKSAHPAKNWLVNIIKDRLRDTPHLKPREIANGIFRDFGIKLNYTQVWRGMEDARQQLQGSYKEAYCQLPWVCKKVLERNPGSVAKLSSSNEKRFQRLFISFHALVRGFQEGCRPILFLNSLSLRSKYQESLLIANAIDGNDGFLPVAFAMVDDENDDSWRLFLAQLKNLLSASGPITFVSDREKGLKKFVLEIFANAHHGYSIYHLMESFKKNLKGPFHGDGRGSLPINFLGATHALRLDGFKKFMEQIKRVSSHAYEWIMQIEPEYWASIQFKGERYNHITGNAAEPYMKLIDKIRELPIRQKMDALINMVVEMTNNCKLDASKWDTKLTPSKEEKIRDETPKANGLKVLISSNTLYEVRDELIHVVDIEKWECTCLAWKGTGLPCCHAIAVFNTTKRSVYDYCSTYFTVDSFRQTYSGSINPLPLMDMHPNGDNRSDDVHVLPPLPSRLPNQQKKESPKPQCVEKRTVSCTKCKEIGHNKATCKADL